jgi:hypothetical protein
MRGEWQNWATPVPRPAAARPWYAFILFLTYQYRQIKFNHIRRLVKLLYGTKIIHHVTLRTIEFINLLNVLWAKLTINRTHVMWQSCRGRWWWARRGDGHSEAVARRPWCRSRSNTNLTRRWRTFGAVFTVAAWPVALHTRMFHAAVAEHESLFASSDQSDSQPVSECFMPLAWPRTQVWTLKSQVVAIERPPTKDQKGVLHHMAGGPVLSSS